MAAPNTSGTSLAMTNRATSLDSGISIRHLSEAANDSANETIIIPPANTSSVAGADPSENTVSAAEKVFECYELAEMILEQLPPGELFQLQRICKSIRDIIFQSKRLQKNLYVFLPVQDTHDGLQPALFRLPSSKIDFQAPDSEHREPGYFECYLMHRSAHMLVLGYSYIFKEYYEAPTYGSTWSRYYQGASLGGKSAQHRRRLIVPAKEQEQTKELWRKIKLVKPGSIRKLEESPTERPQHRWGSIVANRQSKGHGHKKVRLVLKMSPDEESTRYMSGDSTLGQVYEELCEMMRL